MKTAALPVLSLEVAIGKIMGKKNKKNKKKVKKLSVKKVPTASEETTMRSEEGENKKVSDKQWQEILYRVRPQNHSIEAFLKAAYPIGLEGSVLKLGVYYQFHKECLEKEANRRIVEQVASDVLGLPVRIFCQISSKKQRQSGQKAGDEQDLMSVAKTIFGGEKNV